MSRRRIHLDMHTPEGIPGAFADFDANRYIGLLADSGADTVTFFASCIHGHCYYDTRIGHRHADMKFDYLGECSREAKRRGLRVIAYHAVGVQDVYAHAHPDWRQCDAEGKEVSRPNGAWWLCMNTPMRDQLIGQMKEVAAGYPIDGFFLDGTYIVSTACTCASCRAKYERVYGRPMPQPLPERGPGGRDEFRRVTRSDFLRDACAAVRAIKPGLQLTWNHAGDILFGEVEVDELADGLMRECKHPEHHTISFHGRWMRQFGKPFEPMTSVFHFPDWSGYNIKNEMKLRHEASTTLAVGGTVSLGDVSSPRGTLDPAMYQVIGRVLREIETKEPWVDGAESVPDIAVLYSILNHRLPYGKDEQPHARLDAIRGVHKVLVEGHRQFDLIREQGLEKLDRYTMLILHNQRCLRPREVELIERFVRKGGRLVATYETGMYSEDGSRRDSSVLAEMLGIQYEGISDHPTIYVADFAEVGVGLPAMPIMVRSPRVWESDQFEKMPAILVRPAGGRALASLVQGPESTAALHTKADSFFEHPAVRLPNPAIVHNRYGTGECFYFALPLFTNYWRGGYTAVRDLIYNCMDLLRAPHVMEIRAPKTVEAVLTRRGAQTILHLIQYHGNALYAETRFGYTTPVVMEEVFPLHNIAVRLRVKGNRVRLPLRGQSLPARRVGEFLSFTLPELELHEIVVVE